MSIENESFDNYKSIVEKIEKTTKKITELKTEELALEQKLEQASFNTQTIGFEKCINYEMLKDIDIELSKCILQKEKENISTKEEYVNLYSDISHGITNDTVVQSFLKENNTIQRSWLKRLLNIEKDPLKITSKDLKELLPKLKDVYDKRIEKTLTELDAYKSDKELVDLKGNLFEIKDQISELNTHKEDFLITKKVEENKIKNVLDLIIDLDVSSLKTYLKENKIGIGSVLFYIKDTIKSFFNSKENKRTSPDSVEKLKKLEGNLKEIKVPKKHQLKSI